MLRAQDESSEVRFGMIVRSEYAGLLQDHPALSWVHGLDKSQPGSTASIIASIRSVGYDTSIVPHRSLRSGWIAYRSRIPRRVGFTVADAPWLMTDRVRYTISEHEVTRNARLVERAGLQQTDSRPWLIPNVQAMGEMRHRFGGKRPILVLAPGSVWATKRWTQSGFAEVARQSIRLGWRPVLVGSVNESELCRAIASEGGLPPTDNAAGAVSLPQLLALISMAGRVVANDSAPIHLASAVGVPVTAIFGPTVPEFGFGPISPGSTSVGISDLPCRPCSIHGGSACPLGHHRCMRDIDVHRVIATIGNTVSPM